MYWQIAKFVMGSDKITLLLLMLAGCRFDLPEVIVPDVAISDSLLGEIHTLEILPSPCTGGLPGTLTCPFNEIPLDNLGPNTHIPGSKIWFVMQEVGSSTSLTHLKLIPGAMGAYVEHPQFISIPNDPKSQPIVDTLDRFVDVKMNIATEHRFGNGFAAFVNFPPSNKIVIRFEAAKIFQLDSANDSTIGCKVIAQFDASARGLLNANCGSCHGGQDAAATAMLDISGIDRSNAITACNHVRQRLDIEDFNESSLFLVMTPGYANHPSLFGADITTFMAFKDAVTSWAVAERDAP